MTGGFGIRFDGGGALLVMVAPRGQGERLVGIARAAGAGGGTIALGRHPAEGGLLGFLGLGDSDKDVAIVAGPETVMRAALAAVRARTADARSCRGSAALVRMSNNAGERMGDGSNDVMVVAIVNAGLADEAMEAARGAGASGGTILNAKGTGREEDAKFFGVSIFPEKEILLIVTECGKADAIIERMRGLKSLEAPGSGIAFRVPVSEHVSFGG